MIDKNVFNKLVPPTIRDVKIYFSQKGMPDTEAEAFFLFQEEGQWAGKNCNSQVEWKTSARRWIDALIENRPWLFQRTLR